MYQYSASRGFFSHPSTYPLSALIGIAGFFAIGMGSNALRNYKDVKINPARKHQVIRDWGKEPVSKVALVLSKEPIAMHAQHFKSIRQEGLGIDHEEWLKGKQAYSQGQ
jgi:hypothetical protein